MLRFAEELLLLLLRDESGELAFVPDTHLHHALAGAVLMDLALENRIDTDLDKLTLVDAAPLEDDILDAALAQIAASAETHDAEYWVRRIAGEGERIRAAALARMVRAGVLQSAQEDAVEPSLQLSLARRYPAADGKTQQEVRLRVMRVLFADDIPDPRDIVIICLADACGIFEKMLTKAELEEARVRIDLVGRMDLIGQAVTRAVRSSGREAAARPAFAAKRIPRVKGLPILGSAREAAEDVRAFLTEQYLNLGPVFEIRLLHRRMLVLAGPEANRFVQRHGRRYLSSHSPWRGFADGFDASRLMLSMDGPEHVRFRKAFAQPLSQARFHENLAAAANITCKHAAAWPLDRPMQPLHALQGIIADQMGVILAGASAEEYLDDMVFFLETLLKTVVAKQLPAFLFARKFRKARARLDELAQKTMEAHRPGGAFHGVENMVSSILDLHDADPQFFPETDVNAVLLAPYLVGIETVGNTCAFTLYCILKHPELKRKITAEADALFAGGPPTQAKLRKLDVTHRAVLESMRMYPATPVMFRSTANSFEFAGCRIPAGKPLFAATTVTHRLPEFFPDPDRFDIDRYLPERAEHRQANAYAPFGLGTHKCLGAGFAEAQALVTLAAMLHAAEIVMDPPDYELKVSNVPTPRPAKSFRFKVKGLRQAVGQG